MYAPVLPIIDRDFVSRIILSMSIIHYCQSIGVCTLQFGLF